MTHRQVRTNLRTSPDQIATFWPGEQWRPVGGFEGYFVSNFGRVCSVDRVLPSNDKIRRGQLLRPGAQTSGHVTVALGRGNTKGVHTLVLEAFVGPCPIGREGLHADDNPSHNWLSNLRWGTRSENVSDAIGNGKIPLGEQVYNAKLTIDAVRYIRAHPQLNLTILALQFCVSANAVRQVRESITWKHVA